MPSVCCFFFFKNPFILFSFLDIASTILKHMDQINGLSSGTRSAFLSLLRAVRARQMAMERVPMFSFLSFLFKEREREKKKDARFRKGLRRIKLTYEIGGEKKRKRHTHSTVERARTLPWGGPVVTPLN